MAELPFKILQGSKLLLDITGQTFGRLLVLSLVAKGQNARWLCRCDCGQMKVVSGGNLRAGNVQSCGCLGTRPSVQRREFACAMCGGLHARYPSELARRKHLFCSARCRQAYFVRERNPYYLHGLTRTPLYVRAATQKRRARKRNNGGTYTPAEICHLLLLQHHRCYACNGRFKRQKSGSYEFHIDHRIPVSKGGSNDILNLRLLHPKCNISKNNLTPQQWAQRQGWLLAG